MVPLFDRLSSKIEKFEGISKNYLTPIGVEQSVMLELNRLATTRSRLTFDEFIKNNLTVQFIDLFYDKNSSLNWTKFLSFKKNSEILRDRSCEIL